MFGLKLIKEAHLKEIENKLSDLNQKLAETTANKDRLQMLNSDHQERVSEMSERIKELSTELEKKQSKIAELLATIDKEKTNNSVTLTISDDLSSITPIIRTKQNAFEILFQNGYLSDAQNSQHAIELSFMLIANEALSQLIEQFEPQVRVD